MKLARQVQFGPKELPQLTLSLPEPVESMHSHNIQATVPKANAVVWTWTGSGFMLE